MLAENCRQEYLDRLLAAHPHPAVSMIIYADVPRFLDCFRKEAAAQPWMTQELYERLERETIEVSTPSLNQLFSSENYLALLNIPLITGRALPQPILAYPRLFKCPPEQIEEMIVLHEYRHAEQNAHGICCSDRVLDHTNLPYWGSASSTLAEADASIAALDVMRTRSQRTKFFYWSINDLSQRAFVLDALGQSLSASADDRLAHERQAIVGWFLSKARKLLNEGLADELGAYRQKHGFLSDKLPLS